MKIKYSFTLLFILLMMFILSVTTTSAQTPLNVRINFQPPATPTVAGYLVDDGSGFANRGNGFSYGWVLETNFATPLARPAEPRDRGINGDQRLDTLIHMQRTTGGAPPPFGAWKIQVANGEYIVTVSVGDADTANLDSMHRINVEGITLIPNYTPTVPNPHAMGTAMVTVTDGEINVDAIGGTNTKINYIHIVENIAGVTVVEFDVPNQGILQIDASNPIPAYTIPGGQIIQVNGTDLVLPRDADGNGFDTYIITSTTTYQGQTWYSIFIGSAFFVWIPADYPASQSGDTAESNAPTYYGIVNTSVANIRSGDGVAYSSLGTVSGSTRLTILGRNPGRTWWFVEANGLTGWINGELIILRGNLTQVPVQAVNGELVPATILLFADTWIYNTTNNLNSYRMCVLPANGEFNVTAQTQDGVWYRINATCNGTPVTGWIFSDSGAFRNQGGSPVPIINS